MILSILLVSQFIGALILIAGNRFYNRRVAAIGLLILTPTWAPSVFFRQLARRFS